MKSGNFIKRVSLVAAVFFLSACATNPVTGRREFSIVSDKTANEMGAKAYPQIRQEWGGDYSDPKVQAYVASIGKSLAAVSDSPDLPFEFRVTNSSQLNAVTLPGGRIFITRGLMADLENEAQLAAVIGHEIGHATARHGRSAMSRNIALQAVAAVASTIVDFESKTQASRLLGRTALQAGLIGAQIATFKWSRDQENQADELGVIYMMKAGYDPEGAIQVQELLASKEKKNPGYFQALFRSHPVSAERIKHVTRFVYTNEAGYGIYRKGDGLFAARYQEETRKLKEISKAYEPYHLAAKFFKEGRTGDALRENAKAIAMAPREAAFYIQKGDFALKAKDYAKAETAYQKARKLAPDYYKPYERLGHLAKIRGKNDDALTFHKKAIELNAGSGRSYVESGYAYIAKKDYKNAAIMLDAGTKIESANGEAYTALGYSYEKLGYHRNAYHAYRAAARFSKNGKNRDMLIRKIQNYQMLYGH